VAIYPFELSFSDSPYVRFPFIVDGKALYGSSCVLSMAVAGDMQYIPHTENPVRTAFFDSLYIPFSQVYSCEQHHSQQVILVAEGDSTTSVGDGLVTAESENILSVTVADCLPVFFRDIQGRCFGILHSGWKGTGIVCKALELVKHTWNIASEELAVVLGPCIRSCCYHVDPERAMSFEKQFGGPAGPYPIGPVVHKISDTDYTLDLQAANARLLAMEGVRYIAVCQNCTYTDTRLHSFRREGPEAYQRMIALVGEIF
jgi:YfiH family protein